MSDFSAATETILHARLKDDPLHATIAGLHQYDSELPDVTPDGIGHTHAALAAHIAVLEAFTPGDLTAQERIDRQLLMSMLEVELRELTELQPHKHDPSLYPSLAGEAVYSILARDFAPLAQRMPSVVARLRKIPAMLAAGAKNLQRSPKVWTEIAIEETDGVIDFFEHTVAPLLDADAQGQAALKATITALHEYAHFLKEEHRQRDGMSFAVGREFFDYKLKHEHFLPYTAQTLLEFGEQAVRSTEMRLQEVADLIEANANWVDLIDALRAGALPGSDLLDQYRQGVRRTRQFVVERGLVSVPTGETLEVVDTPAFLRPTIPYAAYMAPGAFEQQQQGLYYVTPIAQGASDQTRREQLLGHNTFGMLLTNVHEGYPGHHLQLVVANRAPSLVRRLHDSTVFCEGWALYCEQLVLDEGLDSDPRMRLFQLKDQLWRACRIVIDAKLHTGDMSFDEAVDMLVNVAKLERVNAIGEVRRYTQTPTQPMSYLVGKHQILDLRERERQRLGSRFDLRDFHDRLLAQGSLPVALIEASFASQHGG
jgi:uncharacterized protein (DUF885 family)